MNRRKFLSWVGVGGVASFLPVAIAACSGQLKTLTNQATIQSDGFRAVGTLAELDQKGQLSNQQVAGSPVLVLRHPDDFQQLLAVNPTCTHRGCIVTWEADQKAFICPCHDAKFAPDGKVLQGRAQDPLITYTVKIEQENVLIAVQGHTGLPAALEKQRDEEDQMDPSKQEKETEGDKEAERNRRINY